MGSSPSRVKSMTIKFAFPDTMVSTQHLVIKKDRLLGTEVGQCVRVERHVWPWTAVSMS
jgi:hypothetical protein